MTLHIVKYSQCNDRIVLFRKKGINLGKIQFCTILCLFSVKFNLLPNSICRITSRFPDDPRQPFWNETGTPMKPLAKLTLTRQRLYRKSCAGDDDVPFQEIVPAMALPFDDHGGKA